jgi:hypothetical protein
MIAIRFALKIKLRVYSESISNRKCYIKEPNGENSFLNSVNIVFLIMCIPMVKSYLEKPITF